jgi:hypothetical protein
MKIKLTMGAKQARNAFAVCRTMQKKKGWGERKYERCVKEVKASMGAKKKR